MTLFLGIAAFLCGLALYVRGVLWLEFGAIVAGTVIMLAAGGFVLAVVVGRFVG